DRDREFVQGHAVFGDDADVDRGLLLADLDGHALTMVDPRAGDPVAQRAHDAGAPGTHIEHAADLTGGDTGDLGDNGVGDDRAALGVDGAGRSADAELYAADSCAAVAGHEGLLGSAAGDPWS